MELEHGREVDVRGCRPEHSSGKANRQGGTLVPDRLGWEAAVIDTALGPEGGRSPGCSTPKLFGEYAPFGRCAGPLEQHSMLYVEVFPVRPGLLTTTLLFSSL